MRGTPGKWFLGLAVSDNDGYQLGLVHTTMRAAAKLAVLLVFAPIVLLAVFSRQKQTLYDIFLGTRVIRLSDARDPEKEDDADRTAEPRAREPIAETPGE
jgi:uncharacterized RDD family membrane protein YckC